MLEHPLPVLLALAISVLLLQRLGNAGSGGRSHERARPLGAWFPTSAPFGGSAVVVLLRAKQQPAPGKHLLAGGAGATGELEVEGETVFTDPFDIFASPQREECFYWRTSARHPTVVQSANT